MEGGERLAVFGEHLRRELAVRILKFLEGRDFREETDEQQEAKQQDHRGGDDYPEPLADFLSGGIFHILFLDYVKPADRLTKQGKITY